MLWRRPVNVLKISVSASSLFADDSKKLRVASSRSKPELGTGVVAISEVSRSGARMAIFCATIPPME
ncbi:hypothetical protein D3C72_2479470 [compost metagenome]